MLAARKRELEAEESDDSDDFILQWAPHLADGATQVPQEADEDAQSEEEEPVKPALPGGPLPKGLSLLDATGR